MDQQAFSLDDIRALIAHLPAAVYVCEAPSGAIRLYNPRAAELWGREPKLGDTEERFCGSFRLFRIDGSFLPHAETPMAAVLSDGILREDDVVIERPDASRVTVHVSIAPLRDPEGRLVGAVNVFQDITERRDAEEALRVSEARYRAIVEDQPDLVCRFLADGTVTFANEAYCRYFGLRRDDVAGRRYLPVVHPDDVADVEAAVASLGPTNRVVVIENRVRRGDGAIRWTEWTNHAVYDHRGKLLEYQAAGRDISDRKRAEEDAARLAAIVASADDAIVSKTLDGIITSWNRGAERMFGYPAHEAVGRPISVIIPPDRMEEHRDILARLRRGEAIEPFETERVARDGRRLAISLSVSPIRDARGRLIGASKVARDISERLQAEQNLKASIRTLEMLYRLADVVGRTRGLGETCEAAVEAIMAGTSASRASVLLLDDAGVMRFRAWRGLSERYRAAVDGHSPWSAETSDPASIAITDVLEDPGLAALRDVITAEGIRALAFVPLVHQGRLLGKFMLYHDAPHVFSAEELRLAATIAHHVAFGLARAQGEAAVARALARERAARAEADAARAEAERANQAKDEFLAMLAHELRNPLGVIVNAVAVLDTAGALHGDRDRARLMIRRQAEHLARLLDDLLDVARITSGRIELDRDRVDLGAAVELAAEAQRHRIEAKRQRLSLILPPQPLTVIGDGVRLQQVLGNLLNNASKYTPAGGFIQVALAADAGEAVLSFRDTGAGIPADKLDAIFELFVQANPTLARTEGGLGIGLTLVKRVVELHGGAVRARSDGPGRGAEFTVRLPLAETAAVRDGRPAASAGPTPRRILVVEDHEDGREMLVTSLRLQGHEVLEAATGREAIEAASAHAPEVVLVDIGLPDVEGYEVGREVRRVLGDGVRLVALTGYGQPADRARSEAAGFDAHLVKPVDPPTLGDTLQRL